MSTNSITNKYTEKGKKKQDVTMLDRFIIFMDESMGCHQGSKVHESQMVLMTARVTKGFRF